MHTSFKVLALFSFLSFSTLSHAVGVKTEILENSCSNDFSLKFSETSGNTNLSSHALVSNRSFFVGRNRTCKILILATPGPRQMLRIDNTFARGKGIILSGQPTVIYNTSSRSLNPEAGVIGATRYSAPGQVFISSKVPFPKFGACGRPIVIEYTHRTTGSTGSFDLRIENFSVTAVGQAC